MKKKSQPKQQTDQKEINEKALTETINESGLKGVSNEHIAELIDQSTHVQQLYDICDHLWHVYFLDPKLDKKQKKEVMTIYNDAAKKANKHAGSDRVMLITSSTVWEPKEGKENERVIGKPDAGQKVDKVVGAKAVEQHRPRPKVAKLPGPGGSIIEQILAHHQNGLSNKEIIALGFNKSTVGRQVGEYKKRQQASGK